MLIATVLSLALTQAPVESGPRGDAASTAPASVDERLDVERAQTRLRFGVAAGLAVSSHGGGLGLGLDLGVVLSDRYAVYVRGSLDLFVFTGMALFALMTEYGWDRFSVSAGLGYGGAAAGYTSGRGFSGALIPVVLSLTPFGRGEKSVRRMGFVIAAEGGVGIGPNSGGSADPQWFGWGGLRLGFVMR